jgi:hypothetical protein
MKKVALRLLLYLVLSGIITVAPPLLITKMSSRQVAGSKVVLIGMKILVFPPSQLASLLHLRPTYLARAQAVNFMTSRLPDERPSLGSMVAEYSPIAWPYWFIFLTVYAEAWRLSLLLYGSPPTKPEGNK